MEFVVAGLVLLVGLGVVCFAVFSGKKQDSPINEMRELIETRAIEAERLPERGEPEEDKTIVLADMSTMVGELMQGSRWSNHGKRKQALRVLEQVTELMESQIKALEASERLGRAKGAFHSGGMEEALRIKELRGKLALADKEQELQAKELDVRLAECERKIKALQGDDRPYRFEDHGSEDEDEA